jgi:hypothetical protein
MHPQMSQPQHIHNDFGVFASPHLQQVSTIVPHSTQPLTFNNYDPANYSQDPYAQFDMSKAVDHFQYMSPQQPQTQPFQHHQHPNPSNNHYVFASYPQGIYATPDSRHPHTTTSLSSTESPSCPKRNDIQAPKFDRTYTDALEDELFDESSSTSQSVNSQNGQSVRHPTPNFTLNGLNQYQNHVYRARTLLYPSYPSIEILNNLNNTNNSP